MADFNHLPDIELAAKDTQTIETEVIRAYESAAGFTLAGADPRKLLLQSLVPILVGQRARIDYAGKQNLLAYAEGEALDHLGVLVGVTRLPASHATVTARFTLSAVRSVSVAIPAGKRVTAGDNVFFATTAEAVIPAGQLCADVPARCASAGSAGNGYAAGEIKTLVDPIPYIASVANITESAGGIDAETDDALRERIRQAPESYSTAGPEGAYRYFAMSASALIADVAVYSPEPCVVSIRPLLQNGELPGQEILDLVSETCNAKKVRPLTDLVQVAAPETVAYDIDVQYWIDGNSASLAASIRDKVEAAVTAYALWQKSILGRDIDPSELIYRMKAAGAKRVAVTAPAYREIAKYQVAREAAVTVNYGGLEHG